MSVSTRNLKANRRNARKSTGPRSGEGISRSSRNATSHGIFSSSLLLPGEDAQALRELRIASLRRLNPRDGVELQVVEQFISASWRISRVRAAEAQLFDTHERKLMKGPFGSRADTSTRQVIARMLISDPAQERLQRYEQRLENTMHRCLNQLRKLQDQSQVGCLSEFTGELLAREEPIVQNEPDLEVTSVTDGQTRSSATDGAPMNTDECEEERWEEDKPSLQNAPHAAAGSVLSG